MASNPLFACTSPTCNAKITRNQLYGSNGHCIHCKVKLNHTSWMTGRQGNLSTLIGIGVDNDADLRKVCQAAGINIEDALRVAIELKLKEWLEDPEQTDKRVKQDLMLAKLMRR